MISHKCLPKLFLSFLILGWLCPSLCLSKPDSLEVNDVIPVWEHLSLETATDWSFIRSHVDLSLEASRKSLLLCDSVNYPHRLLHIYHVLGLCYRTKGEFNVAERLFLRAQDLCKSDPKDRNTFINAYFLSTIYLRKADKENLLKYGIKTLETAKIQYDSLGFTLGHLSLSYYYGSKNFSSLAIEHLIKAESYLTSTDRNIFYEVIHSNLGAQYIRSGNFLKARETYEEMIPRINYEERPAYFVISSTNYAHTYLEMGDFQKAFGLLDDIGPKIENLDDIYGKAYYYLIKAQSLQGLRKWEKSDQQLETAEKFLGESRQTKLYGFLQYLKGKSEERRGNLKKALEFYEASLPTADPIEGFGSVFDSYEALSNINYKMGNRARGEYYTEEVIRMKDSLYQEWQRDIYRLLSKQDSLQRISNQIEEMEDQREREKLQNRFLWAGIFSLIILAGLALALLRNFYIRKREENIRAHNEQLKAYTSELEDMAYATSHYLKEPVRGVGAYAGLVRRKLKDKVDQGEKEDLSYLTQSAKRLSLLMSELSNFFKLGTELPPLKRIHTGQLLRESIDKFRDEIEDINGDVRLKGDFPILHLHPSLMALVFDELILNALKYRGEKPFLMDISYRDNGKDHLFSFKDHGRGLSPNHSNKVFGIFYQIDPYELAAHGGVGMGLAKVRKVVRLYKGQAKARGQESQFTEILLSLPKDLD